MVFFPLSFALVCVVMMGGGVVGALIGAFAGRFTAKRKYAGSHAESQVDLGGKA